MPFAHAVSSLLFALADDTVAIRVSYDAPASCPSESALYDAVRARTDHVRRASPDESALDVNVRVSRTERGFVGEVRETLNHTESSARSVDGETCKEVVEALSLTIALSVDPNAHAPVPAPPAEKPAPAACPPAAEAPRIVPPPAPPGVQLEIGLSALGTEVLTSNFSAGSALSGTLLRQVAENRSASLELSLLFAATGLSSSAGDSKAVLEGLSLELCPVRWQLGSVELGPCALAEAGVLEVTGRGVTEPDTVTRSWWSTGLDFQFSALLGQGFVLESALGASAPLTRRKFYVAVPDHIVAETPIIAPMARIGLGFRF